MASRYIRTLKVVFQIGLFENLNYLKYQCLLRGGLFRFLTPAVSQNQSLSASFFNPAWLDFWPTKESVLLENTTSAETINQAETILNGEFLQFGVNPSEINLSPKTELCHWSQPVPPFSGTGKQDIKFIWESARFSWAIKLAQAFYLTGEEKYAQFFWKKYAEFLH